MGTHPIFESDFDCLTDAETSSNVIEFKTPDSYIGETEY